MATLKTYEMIGQKENVSDIISNLSPTDRPFSSAIKNEKISARVFQWQEDSLAAAADNKHVEGGTHTSDTASPTVMRSNNTQILAKTFAVSGTGDAVSTYGRSKETSYQLAKRLKELALDLEFAFVGHANAAVAGNASTAREMASATAMISTSLDAGSGSTDPLTEAKLNTIMQTIYTNGSSADCLMIKPADSLIVSAFASASGRNRNFDQSTTLTNSIDVLITSFGTYRVVLNRHLLSTHALLLDMSMWREATLREASRELLAKSGDADTHMVLMEKSLKHMNFADGGMITGLS